MIELGDNTTRFFYLVGDAEEPTVDYGGAWPLFPSRIFWAWDLETFKRVAEL